MARASLVLLKRRHAACFFSGAFELASFRTRPGAAAPWAAALGDSAGRRHALGDAHLIGAFHGDIGHPDTGQCRARAPALVSVNAGAMSLPSPVYALRWFESADARRRVESDAAGETPASS